MEVLGCYDLSNGHHKVTQFVGSQVGGSLLGRGEYRGFFCVKAEGKTQREEEMGIYSTCVCAAGEHVACKALGNSRNGSQLGS